MKSLTNSLNSGFGWEAVEGFHYDRALNDIQTWKAGKAAGLDQAGRAGVRTKCNRKAREI